MACRSVDVGARARCKKRGTQCVERFRLARRTAQEMKLLRKKKSKKKVRHEAVRFLPPAA